MAATSDSEKRAKVSRILTFSCVDGPGNRLVIFLQGCNFSCVNCHNPHTINHCNHCGICVEHCPDGALTRSIEGKVFWNEALCSNCDKCIDICSYQSNPKGWNYSVPELVEIIRDSHLFLQGITISGGEATLELPFITELFKAIKADKELSHLTCFVDSNGSLPDTGWDRILPYLDGAMIDLKAWQTETHEWLAGRGNHRVIKSINYLAAQNKLYEVRLLLIPGKTDLTDEVSAVGDYLNRLPSSVAIRINAFQHHGVSGEALFWDTCTKEDVENFRVKLTGILGRNIITPPTLSLD
ncbi:YjjW family glycine radical enzyme activase [Vibrio hannami]|uniref:YjjW family glycine radical enzyme activase n=1 Tax=Vibrio hannami TaxID=2717094 RepID=UPI00241037B2|nr:YjjW family glycine radical enzyme activase [Vibrio hannami]MDG3085816.1 YjjW family glycine radical enzyme activase [Vibrio hannami]